MFHIPFDHTVACNMIPLHSSSFLSLVSTAELPMDCDQITGLGPMIALVSEGLAHEAITTATSMPLAFLL